MDFSEPIYCYVFALRRELGLFAPHRGAPERLTFNLTGGFRMTNKKVRRGLALGLLSLVFLFLYHSPAGAVDIAGKIIGTITDQSGAVVPDAMVVARSADTGVE